MRQTQVCEYLISRDVPKQEKPRFGNILIYPFLFDSVVAGCTQVSVPIGQNFLSSDNLQTFITPADANGAPFVEDLETFTTLCHLRQ